VAWPGLAGAAQRSCAGLLGAGSGSRPGGGGAMLSLAQAISLRAVPLRWLWPAALGGASASLHPAHCSLPCGVSEPGHMLMAHIAQGARLSCCSRMAVASRSSAFFASASSKVSDSFSKSSAYSVQS